jgi:NADPH:quinone reductase-like Zn-dependent oxidoreductase
MYTKLVEWCEEDSSKIAPYVEYSYNVDNYKEAFHLLNDRKMVGKAVIEWIKSTSKL